MRLHLATPLLVMSLAAAVPVRAGTLYGTGFESPNFITGVVAGQDGWAMFRAPGAVVQTALVKAGTQAVEVFGSAPSQAGPYYAAAFSDSVINMSADLYLSSSASESGWQFAATGSGLTGFAGGINVNGTTIKAISGAFPVVGTFARDTWNHVEIILDFGSQTSTIKLNGVTLAASLPFCGSNAGCTGAPVSAFGDAFFDSFGGANRTDFGFMDNFSIASVPETSTWIQMGLGLFALGAWARRRALGR